MIPSCLTGYQFIFKLSNYFRLDRFTYRIYCTNANHVPFCRPPLTPSDVTIELKRFAFFGNVTRSTSSVIWLVIVTGNCSEPDPAIESYLKISPPCGQKSYLFVF
ncbi:hypothetical protein BLOT_011260 [Blomia tropicalis]|nr:hypothetical protein BLOT_011260 [Blomia tropicalis]